MGPYMRGAQAYIKLLQKNERAGNQVEIVEQGKEANDFWALFFGNSQKSNQLYGNVNEWNQILIDVSILIVNFNPLSLVELH